MVVCVSDQGVESHSFPQLGQLCFQALAMIVRAVVRPDPQPVRQTEV
jgi:hypothetical protein